MREKELHKLADIIVDKIEDKKYGKVCVEQTNNGTLYDENVSNNFKKIIKNILKYNENLTIDVSEDSINISTNNIENIKKPINKNLIHDEDKYLELSLNKYGFRINYGYNKHSEYKDDKIYDELKPIIESRLKEINSENFNLIFDEVMKVSGMLRDNNLEELLDGE